MSLRDLGELQLTVLQILWECNSATVHEVLEALPEERTVAYTTVLTVLRKLEQRGLVAHEPTSGQRMFRYRSIIDSEEIRESMVSELIEQMFSGSPILLVKHLLNRNLITEGELTGLLSKARQEDCLL